ncbi:histidyl-tRNA synthetase [Heliomicrobium modesticaldum Ice1]|uniref:ATP phosphoribosyltransferase regulatory subunit n=1 Tax=Heliobacterium modesticaldum (strain ATCC 51547 / Ice1) TaxID=498761 RepID=B0TDN5_HELMI|nr:ATP phosphoribosyltransferase regulatory subunit [Heliomicrobium modesticaldum]ABZ85560.1 histidyl-tRNA synthetase [Heliomicrobium modesticaldum Ice1]
MAKEGNLLQIPPGMRDLLPGNAREKRLLENEWVKLFSSWGYQEVATPTVEYLDTLALDTGEEIRDRLFQFFDRQGRILALRPEMTTPIARLVATRLRQCPFPQRLFYVANVFRYEEPQAGRQREISQAGVELIGAPGPLADAEVIAMAVEALRASGLEDFQISLGQIEVFNGVMEELPLDAATKARVRALVAKKDFVSLEELLATSGLDKAQSDLLLTLPTLHGGREVLIQALPLAVNDRARRGLENLRTVYEGLRAFGVEDYVAIDLGVLRGFDYYTGVVFESYTVGLGFPICGGGRYDSLLGQFGFDTPATGFALGIDRVLLALSRSREPKPAPASDVVIGGGNPCKIMAEAVRMRKNGLSVEIDLMNRSEAELEQYAAARAIAQWFYYPAGQDGDSEGERSDLEKGPILSEIGNLMGSPSDAAPVPVAEGTSGPDAEGAPLPATEGASALDAGAVSKPDAALAGPPNQEQQGGLGR